MLSPEQWEAMRKACAVVAGLERRLLDGLDGIPASRPITEDEIADAAEGTCMS